MRKIVFFSLISLLSISSKADEGMWLLPKLKAQNMDSMRKLGLNLTAEDIYSVTNPSLKDAIVIFGKGCTGEVISAEGLILTNHHCGLEAIQKLSSVEHDYLKDGFWAKNRNEELSCNGLSVSFMVKFEDVTDSIIPFLSDTLSEIERQKKVTTISQRIEKANADNGKFVTEIREFYGGNEYYLLVYKVFNDVRLVGAPPTSIGKFGADTDNWMWPRHNGDFSVFRVYSGKDSSQTKFDSSNQPLKTPKFLPISLKGYEKNSFTMIIGYPGTTERYNTSAQIQELMNISNPIRIKVRGVKQNILLKDMKAAPKTRIQYASKYSRSSNYWKHSIGQNKGLKTLNVIERKKIHEHELMNWIHTDSIRTKKYGNSINNIESIVDTNKELITAINLYNESIIRGIELYTVVRALTPIYEELKLAYPRAKELSKATSEAKETLDEFYSNYNPSIDQKVAPELLQILDSDLDASTKFPYLIEVSHKYKNEFKEYTDKLYKKTFLTNKDKVYNLLQNPERNIFVKDPAFKFFYNFIETYRIQYKQFTNYKIEVKKNQRLQIAANTLFNKSKPLYPDANFSMRLTYGSIQDYQPADAVHYNYQTTLKGVFEKEDSTSWEFNVPSKLKEIYDSKNYKPYSLSSSMPVAFITNNDITGGNSGSPLINANGEIIGVAFDGNWEAMSGNIIFEPTIQRTIAVDIRYVLLVIDKIGNAKYLLNEMDIKQ